MSATTKIVLGAILTALLAWFLYGPMGLGARCAAVPEPAPVPIAPPVTPPTAPAATAEAVASCQTSVDAAIKDKTINFGTGGADIHPDSFALITTVGKAIAECAGTKIEVAGYTDRHGSTAINQPLSERRAASVMAALVKQGVPADRLTAKGFGSTTPVDTAETPAADARNRRIEFHVATAAAPTEAPAAASDNAAN